MLSAWHRSGGTVRGTPATDTEALQTDVMRFIAIIGLCLTAIFSLMRSIAEPVENIVDNPESEMLRQQLHSLQEKITLEQRSIQALEDKLNNSQVRLALADRQAHELQQLRSQLSGLGQALNTKNKDQLQLEKKLAYYSAKSHSLKQQLKTLQQQAVSAPEKQAPALLPPKDPAPSAPVARESEPTPKAPEPAPRESEPIPRAPEPAPGKAVQKGFVLKFASERALSELIDKGQVKLLAVAKRQAWQLRLRNQRLVFQKTPMPDKYHEMLPETLPYRYQHAFYSSVDQAESTGTLWAVQIPLSTEHQVQSLLQTASAGELIIQADGRVSLQSGDNR